MYEEEGEEKEFIESILYTYSIYIHIYTRIYTYIYLCIYMYIYDVLH